MIADLESFEIVSLNYSRRYLKRGSLLLYTV